MARDCGRRDATARVAHLLCETAVRMRAGDAGLVNPFTQQQIADITGQTSSTSTGCWRTWSGRA